MKEVLDASSKTDSQTGTSNFRTSVNPEVDNSSSAYRPSTAPSDGKSPHTGEESSTDIVFIKNDAGHVSVKLATLPKLVERLLNPLVHGFKLSYVDNHFTQTFLLNYKSIVDAHQLLQMITAPLRSDGGVPKPAQPQVLKQVSANI